MDTDNNTIKSTLLSLFNEGKNETEVYEEMSKSHSSYSISLNTVNKWFEIFRSEQTNLSGKKKPGPKPKITNKHLIKLVNDNPGLNMTELAKLSNTGQPTISKRLKFIGDSDGKVDYVKKKSKKFTNESLINPINDNPNITMKELANLLDVSTSAISQRIKKINSTRLNDDKIILQKSKSNSRKKPKKVNDENLIKLINENPELTMMELAKLLDVSTSAVSKRLKKLNAKGEKVSYNSKRCTNGAKFTNEFLINLVNENTELNMTELAKLANTSDSTIARRLKQINTEGEKVNYNKKGSKNGVKKFTDEFLINLVNENPELNMTKLAKLANTTASTIARRLKQINAGGEKVNYNKKGSKSGVKKFTDEFLINLVNENPELNMTKLAKLANTTRITVSNRLKQINDGKEKVKYNYKR